MFRFWEKVDTSGECWEWMAGKDGTGYGGFKIDGKMIKAHRYAYSVVYGPIPEGMNICHHCDNEGCVRPSHLFLGTQKDNVQDSIAKGRFANLPDTRGEKHSNSRLVENDVREIRRLRSLGVMQTTLAKMWMVSRPHISHIVARKKWKHI